MSFLAEFEKTALSSAGKTILKHVGGLGLGGAALGGLEGATRPVSEKGDKSKKRFHNALGGAIGGGLVGGLVGLQTGSQRVQHQHYSHGFNGFHGGHKPGDRPNFESGRRAGGKGLFNDLKSSQSHLGLSGKETHKAHVKKKFVDAAKKHHPDKGGSEEMQKKTNAAWEHIRDSAWFKKLAQQKTAALSPINKLSLGIGAFTGATGALTGAAQNMAIKHRIHMAVGQGKMTRAEGKEVEKGLVHPARNALKSGVASGLAHGLAFRALAPHARRLGEHGVLGGTIASGMAGQLLSQQNRFNSPGVRKLLAAESEKAK